MTRSDQVHWYEGLFLQPHHLQTMQRFLLEQSVAARALACPYPYGVVAADLSQDALKNNRVQFDHLHVVMRSGLELIYPGNADLDPLEIGASIGGGGDGLLIELALPLWQPDGVNAVPATSTDGWGSRYRIRETQQPDENTGINPQPITVRRLNARLVVGGDTRPGVETLPILQVISGGRDGRPSVDPSYIPPSFVIGGSHSLIRIVGEIADQLQAARKEAIPGIIRDGFNLDALQPMQFGELLRLRILSRFGATLSSLVRAPNATPFQVYLELAALLAELVSINPEKDRDGWFEIPQYNHENLALCFYEIADRARALIGGKPPAPVLTVNFKPEGPLLVGELEQKHFGLDRYYLNFKGAGDAHVLAQMVQEKNTFKLMARNEALQRPIWGINLQPVLTTPEGLPNGIYFRLDLGDPYSKERWAKISTPENRNMIAIKFPPGRLPSDANVSLVMPLGNKAKGGS